MKFHSTNNPPSHKTAEGKKIRPAGFKDALMSGLAPDGGLFMPESFPGLSKSFLNDLSEKSFNEIALAVSKKYINDIPEKDLKMIIRESFNFEIPLREISEKLYVLELFHGPTMAFKDFGARFMARLMDYYTRKNPKAKNKKLNIIVATSGDTGSAVARGFYNLSNINVFVLYPSKRVTDLQEKQMTTLGKNITAVEVKGSFDDCQRLAKQALGDPELKDKIMMSSANSINFGRLLPQSFYYFYGIGQFLKLNANNRTSGVVFCVPSGNFGNLTAGLMAERIGLNVSGFIAATNKNDVVPRYLKTGKFVSRVSRRTISNAMDVGSPSNFVRILEMFSGDVKQMRKEITGISVSGRETRKAIRNVYQKTNYLIDPHTAVGIAAAKMSGIKKYIIVLSTAHPAKFRDVVEPVIGIKISLPPVLQSVIRGKKKSIFMKNNLDNLKSIILKVNQN